MSESGADAVVDAATGGWRRATGIAGLALGVVAAGAAAGVAVERLTVGREMRREARMVLDSAGPFGELRGTPGRAYADDGTELYYEIDEIDGADGAVEIGGADGDGGPGAAEGATTGAVTGAEGAPAPRGSRAAHDADGADAAGAAGAGADGGAAAGGGSAGGARRPSGRRAPAPVTVVFCHGYCLNQDSWHFQRAALRGAVRGVYWDQRSHGRSGRGVTQGRDGEPVTIDGLGRDLRAVLDAAAPEGPVVLVGHSMGGMTVMALADQFPEFVRERVAGVALVGTSSGRLGEVNFGLPVAGVNAVRRLLPGVLRALGQRAELVERGRRATADLFAGIVKRYSFAGRDIDPAVARFAERMIESTPIDVVAEFYPAFDDHDKTAALARFRELPVLVLAGVRDLVTPGGHSEAIAELLPGAELVMVPDAGHLVMLEHPALVTDRLTGLIARARERARGDAAGPGDGGARGPAG
ncbi:alpha/beta hydrolase [Streptomyces sp. SID8352]|uniref:alpha/beta fold hydrolase n=1 Tax=Streptomyces sp. SID8352 TaxID=2690338 RepID=UPI0031F6E5C7